MDWIENIKYKVFIVLVVIILMYHIYEYLTERDQSDIKKYEDFNRELRNDMDRYGIEDKDQAKIEAIVEKIIDKKKKEKNMKSTINACKNSLIRGCLISAVTGGDISGILSSGVTHAAIGTLIHRYVE